MQIVMIEWKDSMHSSGWHSFNEFKSCLRSGVALIKTVGFLVEDTPDQIAVIQSGSANNIDAILVIPKCAVVRVEDLGRTELDLTQSED